MSRDKLEKGLQDDLAAWDPAERFGPPSADVVARARMAMHGVLDRPVAFVSPGWLPWAAITAILAMAVIAWGLGSSPRIPDAVADAAPLRLQIETSNGTRIFWTIQPARSETTAPAHGENHDDT